MRSENGLLVCFLLVNLCASLSASWSVSADDTDVFVNGLDGVACEQALSAAPVTPVSQLNPFEHQKEIYYPVFQPSSESYWRGNIKRYELGETKAGRRNILSYLGGGQSKYAIGDCPGEGEEFQQCFSHGNANSQRARSWWNNAPSADGALVVEGGAAAHIGEGSSRNVYVQTSATALVPAVDLQSGHYFLEKSYGSPLHSKPLIVDYGEGEGGVRRVLFSSTNGGFIHAVDAETGSELSVIFPKSLQHNISAYKNKGNGRLVYGMDGQWTVWRHDGNADGRIDRSNGKDFVYLYGGMRRGGRNFYGFDMTDPKHPQILFDISPSVDSRFSHLGQVWAKPTLAWVRIPNVAQPVAVLIIGGGYDPNYDPTYASGYASGYDQNYGTTVNEHADAELSFCENTKVQCGNQVFMILAQKKAGAYRAGDVVWWSSQSVGSSLVNPKMKDSVVGRIRTLDEDGDGYFDRFYVVDISGRVFVYSFSQVLTKERHKRDVSNLSVSLLAKLNSINRSLISSGVESNGRFFYESPSLSVGKDRLGYYQLITIGSGWRANPLSRKTNDAFFVIKDRPSLARDLPLFANDFPEYGGHFFADKIMLNGFQVSLSKVGEKVFGSSSVINNSVFFSTYIPEKTNKPSGLNVCGRYRGGVALYGINVGTGLGVFNSKGGILNSAIGGSYVLRGLGLSSLGDINSVMTGKSLSLLSGSQFVGELDVPQNLVHRLSWHEAARGGNVFQLFPREEEKN